MGKTAVSIVLLVFVAASVVYLAIDSQSPGSQAEKGAVTTVSPAVDEPPVPQSKPKLVAYYFHRTQRCETCLTIEAYAHEALTTAFSDEFKTGQLEWSTINIELPANEHFIQKYELVTSTLVLVRTESGKPDEWRALYEVWDLVGKKEAFLAYVEKEARELMETDS